MLLHVIRRRSKSRIANSTSHTQNQEGGNRDQTKTHRRSLILESAWFSSRVSYEAIPAQGTYPRCRNTLEEVI